MKERFLEEGILPSQLIVRRAKERDVLAKQFYEADLVMMPSRTEGFGLAALEALSAGLPVLVSSNSGVGKALKKVLYGSYFVVNSEKPKKWAKAIRTICSKERELRLREAIFLRQSYAETYQWEGQCSTLVGKMLEMIKGQCCASTVYKFLILFYFNFPYSFGFCGNLFPSMSVCGEVSDTLLFTFCCLQ